jgi:hypothetical protein
LVSFTNRGYRENRAREKREGSKGINRRKRRKLEEAKRRGRLKLRRLAYWIKI